MQIKTSCKIGRAVQTVNKNCHKTVRKQDTYNAVLQISVTLHANIFTSILFSTSAIRRQNRTNIHRKTSLSTFATTYTTHWTIYRATGYRIIFRDNVTSFVIGHSCHRTNSSTNRRRYNIETGHIHKIVPPARKNTSSADVAAREARTSQANKFAISWWLNEIGDWCKWHSESQLKML